MENSPSQPKPRKQAIAIKGLEREARHEGQPGGADDRVSSTIAARGAGKLAEKIIAIARERGITIKEDVDLVGLLAKLDLEEALPPELHALVAELLGFAYQLNKASEGAGADEEKPQEAGDGADATQQATAETPGERHVEIEPGEAELDEIPRRKQLEDMTGPTSEPTND